MTVTRTRVLVALIAGLGAVALLASPTLELVAGCVRAEVWPAPLLALVTVADGLTAVAYAWIPVTLIGVWRQRRGVDLGGVETLRTLEQGLRRCLARMGRAP